MGVDIGGAFLVGRDYDDLQEWYEAQDSEDSFSEVAEDFGLERASPYYDASEEECFFGVSVMVRMNVSDTMIKLSFADDTFERITGMKGVVYAGQDVT